MVYNVIGLMSGSSLDGLDVAYVELTEISGKWTFELKVATTVAYDSEMLAQLKNAPQLPIGTFLELHTSYGRWIGRTVKAFIDDNNLHHKVHFITSHGHTAYHNPAAQTCFQLGDGASIAAVTKINVISDLRNMDVALNGQGAPIVPIMDHLLLSQYDFCLNIGGIANITINNGESLSAFDICPANQVLNHFAMKLGHAFDEGGNIARTGVVNNDILQQLNNLSYYHSQAPKSLANTYTDTLLALLANLSPADALATATQHIAEQIAISIPNTSDAEKSLLVSGGGAFNTYLLESIETLIPSVKIVVPEKAFIDYKEAIAMALIGALRWREEVNVFSSVTGSQRDNVNGALWVN